MTVRTTPPAPHRPAMGRRPLPPPSQEPLLATAERTTRATRRPGSPAPLGPRHSGGSRRGPAVPSPPSPLPEPSAEAASARTGTPRAQRRTGASRGVEAGTALQPEEPRRLPAPSHPQRAARASPLSGAAAAARAKTPPSPRGHLGDSPLANASRRAASRHRAGGREL